MTTDHSSLCENRRVSLIHAGLPPRWPLAGVQRHARAVETGLQGPDLAACLVGITHKTCRTTPSAVPPSPSPTTTCLTRSCSYSAEGVLDVVYKGPLGTQPCLPWFAAPYQAHAGQEIIFGH